VSYTRLIDILPHQAQNYAKQDSICAKVGGVWKHHSTEQCIEIIDAVSLGLLAMGFRPGDKMAIVSPNRPEWNFADLGILGMGGVNVPVYPTISEEEYKFIFKQAEVKLCFVSDRGLYDKINSIKPDTPSLTHLFTFDKVAGLPHWQEVTSQANEGLRAELKRIQDHIRPADLATLIYTSGTTGLPKGVMLSHHNIVENIKSSLAALPIDHTHTVFSFLPLCHSFERMVVYLYMATGSSVYYAESMDTIGDNLREVKPHWFTAVPRLLEKVFDRIMAKGGELKGIKRSLFFWSLRLGEKYEYSGKGPFYHLQLAVANSLVFKKWRAALGGNVIGIVVGAAALQPRLARIFNAGKIPVKEGYGLTETSPVLSFNRFSKGDARFGTVGLPIDGVEVKLAEDREILARGPNIMMGYYKNQEATGEVIDKEGWFHTGDIGEFVDGRFLRIIERKKELYKTSGGKYVAPQAVENKLKESPMIEQAMAIGDGQKFVAALIQPTFPALRTYCEQNNLGASTKSEMVSHPEVIAEYNRILDELNPALSHTEQVKKFVLVPDEWSTETGELTPTLKLRRKVMLSKYAQEIERMYS
jgi:long-chain acyl-CoA synthetase